MAETDVQALIDGARRGDRAAVAGFVAATLPEVWRFQAHMVDPATADDLTQETYLRALRALPAFRGDCSVRTWLLAIARRAAADELRARRRRPALLAGAEPVLVAVEPDVAQGVAVRDLLARLEPARREAFVLTQILGMQYAEAAALCGCPVGTIRSRVARAREDLVRLTAEVPAGTTQPA